MNGHQTCVPSQFTDGINHTIFALITVESRNCHFCISNLQFISDLKSVEKMTDKKHFINQ